MTEFGMVENKATRREVLELIYILMAQIYNFFL